MKVFPVICIGLFLCLSDAHKSENKYSQELNVPDNIEHLKEMKTPLRMNKLNLVWAKAVKKLSLPKLKKLLGELRFLDKEEITLKKLKAEGGDKGGIKEAELRKKLLGILKNHGLDNHFEDKTDGKGLDPKIHKAIFSDKKLNKLWDKALKSGFSEDELKALKEEFQHHQDKLETYYSLIDEHQQNLNQSPDLNSIDNEIFTNYDGLEASEKHSPHPTNTIREKHEDLKKSLDRLHKIASTGPNSQEFIEPKVSGLWKLANNADFNQAELDSLYIELKHYENRLLKVRHLTGQIDLKENENLEEKLEVNGSQQQTFIQQKLEKQRRKIDKLHEDLEMRILARHSEL